MYATYVGIFFDLIISNRLDKPFIEDPRGFSINNAQPLFAQAVADSICLNVGFVIKAISGFIFSNSLHEVMDLTPDKFL